MFQTAYQTWRDQLTGATLHTTKVVRERNGELPVPTFREAAFMLQLRPLLPDNKPRLAPLTCTFTITANYPPGLAATPARASTTGQRLTRLKYKLEFSSDQWEEIEALQFTGFQFQVPAVLYRDQWLAIARLALGRAELVQQGLYGSDDSDGMDTQKWNEDLREIANTILTKFRPGDCQF